MTWTRWRRQSPEALVNNFHGGLVVPTDVRGICRHIGIKIVDDTELQADVRAHATNTEAQVQVKDSLQEWQKRFAISWALGSLLLHGPGTYERHMMAPAQSAAASEFAADLLVPPQHVRRLFGPLSMEAIAGLLYVSKEAVGIQILRLMGW